MDPDSAEVPNFFNELGKTLSGLLGIKTPARSQDLAFSRWHRFGLLTVWAIGYLTSLLNMLDRSRERRVTTAATKGTMAAAEQIHAATKEVQAEVKRMASETSRAQRLAIRVGVVMTIIGAIVGGFAGAFAAKLIGG